MQEYRYTIRMEFTTTFSNLN